MSNVFVGDIGTVLLLDCVADISTATVMKIRAKTPRGNVKEWAGSLDGQTRIRYVIQAGDIDVAGDWALQAYVEMPGWSGRGLPAALKVM